MSKFKVGNIIIGNELANSRYGITVEGWKGEVTCINPLRATDDDKTEFDLEERYFDLFSTKKKTKKRKMKVGDKIRILDTRSADWIDEGDVYTVSRLDKTGEPYFEDSRNPELSWAHDRKDYEIVESVSKIDSDTVAVDFEFVLQAYKAANVEMRKKLRSQIPTLAEDLIEYAIR